MDKLKFSEGSLWENKPWEIDFNVEVYLHELKLPCKHCYDLETRIGDRSWDTEFPTYESFYAKCPRVIIAINEGGHSSTGLCLDCVLEKVKENKLNDIAL